MAILTRPLFHSQERIDLEDLVQLQSGLRTDARLWTRQVLADKNFILKGFDVSGIGTNQIAVNLLDATLLFAGRRDLTGVATIIVDGGSVAGDTLTIANSDGSSFTTTAAASGSNSATNYLINSNPEIQATNIAASITLIGSGLAAAAVSNNITVTASRTGYQTITASNPSNFNNNGSIIGTFDYAADTIESPSDLSYFILQSGATGVDTSITREISASERALTGIASKTLYVYGKLVTGQGTPITKAFWDPSANSGAGAEFNQRVDTASDLEMQLNIQESELDQVTDAAATEFFANVAICQIEVDSSGIILAVRDTRPLFFEAQDDRPWARANAYASMKLESTITNVNINVTIPAGIIPVVDSNGNVTRPAKTVTASEGGPFTLDETVSFWTTGAAPGATPPTPAEPFTSAQVQSLSGVTTDFNKLDLAAVPSRQRIAIGQTSGTIRIVDEVRSNFFRDDKALGDFRNGLSALATEINNMKGTENWYDDPPASAKDLLRFINSTIVGLQPDARYSWEAAGTADGTLSLQLDPLSTVEVLVAANNSIVATNALSFTDTRAPSNTRTITAVSSAPTPAAAAATLTISGISMSTVVEERLIFTINRIGVGTLNTTIDVMGTFSTNAAVAAAIRTLLIADTAFNADYTVAIATNTAQLNLTARATGTDYNGTLTLQSSSSFFTATPTDFTGGAGLGASTFLIGTDAEATASHLTSSINFNDGLSASFSESDVTPGAYRITIGRSVEAITAFSYSGFTGSLTPTSGTFPDAGNVNALANIRLYGVSAAFTFPADDYTVGANEVVFVTLPDLDADSVSNVTFDGTPFRYSLSGPTSTAGGAAWNATNRDIFQGSNNIVKTVPIADFESNERNYWIAYRDNAETIYIRDVGELGTGESANIGHGISNATLSYIGAPSENVSTPAYPLVDTINSFPPTGTEGAYLTTDGANDFNKTLVAQSENLTSAVNDLNDHLTSIKDTQYQNLGLKLVNGGYWGWAFDTGVGTLTNQFQAQIQVPGLIDNRNTIIANGSGTTMENDGDVLYVDINRQDNRTTAQKATITQVLVVKANVNTARTGVAIFVPTRDRIVIARRLDEFVYVGINGTIRLANDQAAPLDSALQFIGVNGSGQLPRALNTAPVGGTTTLSIGTSTVTFPTGGNNTTGTTDDTSVTLELPINGGVLFWEGARFDFSTGIVENQTMPFTPFRARTGGDTTFSFVNLEAEGVGREVIYAISLDDAGTITAMTGADLLPESLVTPNIGKRLGEPNITVGDVGFVNPANGDRAIPPEFGGALPIALVRITTAAGSATYESIDMNRVTVLGASGSGGGGGTGNAVQDINNYLNRLNGSTFGYFSALVPAISVDDFIDSNSTAGIANAGISLTTGLSLLTTNLIDPEFIEDRLIPERVEIEAIWGQTTEFPITTQIDPNARWSISFNASDSTSGTPAGMNAFTSVTPQVTRNVVGVITSSGILVGTNLTNAPVSPILTAIDTFFVENHGFSTGHKISLTTAGGLTLTDATNIYVHSIDADSFVLYSTVANADLGGSTGRIEITATTLGSPVFTRGAGIIPRIGHTNTSRVIFDQRNVTLDGGDYSTTTNPEVRLFVTGDADAAVGSPDALMTSTALFYADQLGIEGVNPNGLDDLNNMIRGSHLVNPVNANASYGANGRGVLLLDGDSNSAEIAVDGNQKITRNGNVALNDNVLIDLSDVSTVGTIGAGQLLARNSGNTAWENQDAPAAGAAGVIQVDTYETASGSFSYIVPAGVTALRVTASGGGAVGSNGTAIGTGFATGGVGGNAGQYDVRYIPVTGSGQSLSVVIGGAASPTSISGTGITTSTWTAGGGEGGSGGSATIGSSNPFRINSRDGGSAGTAGSGFAGGGGSGGNNPRAIGGNGGSGVHVGGVTGGATGGGGGGAGWVDGSLGGNGLFTVAGAAGGAGGRGGMVIEALGITVNNN